MESLYCLMNINTEREYVKSITFFYLVIFIPPSPNTKSRVWHRSPLWYEIPFGVSTSFMNI